jgi:uncharacterized protein YndB with AHSA1/START domain
MTATGFGLQRGNGHLTDGGRVHSASRVILASPQTLFRTFMDQETLLAWRAPDSMSGEMLAFDPRIGGGYRMILRYQGDDARMQGKSRPGEDEVSITFLEMLPGERVVEGVRFVSDDPAFQGEMVMTTLFEPMREGTKVTLRAENVPEGITAEGMLSSLRSLARLTE